MLSIHSLEKYTLTIFQQTIDINIRLYVELTSLHRSLEMTQRMYFL